MTERETMGNKGEQEDKTRGTERQKKHAWMRLRHYRTHEETKGYQNKTGNQD